MNCPCDVTFSKKIYKNFVDVSILCTRWHHIGIFSALLKTMVAIKSLLRSFLTELILSQKKLNGLPQNEAIHS